MDAPEDPWEMLPGVGAALADVLREKIGEVNASRYPARVIANLVRIYPGPIPPALAEDLEREIRRGIRARWDSLNRASERQSDG